MPRSRRFRGVQRQDSQTEAGTSSAQQSEASTSVQDVHAGPSSVPDIASSHSAHQFTADGSGRVTRKRGRTVARDVWQMPEGEKIVIECNELGQPINKAASILSSFLGTVARRHQLCPLSYAKWNDMLPMYKVEILRLIQSKFVLPPSSHDFVLKSLNRKWKEYKAYLKMKYKLPGMTEEEVVGTCPPDVSPHQWIELVHYWFSERGQKYSDIGRATRASLSVPHTSGSKSYARVRHEFMDEHGREPGQVEFYRMTHTHRDGTFIRDESRDICERATALVAERVDDSTASTQSSRIEAEVFTELMGSERYGRVRGYGVGVTPTQLSAVSRHTREAAKSTQDARVRRLEDEIEEMRRSHAAELEEIRQSHAADRAAMVLYFCRGERS